MIFISVFLDMASPQIWLKEEKFKRREEGSASGSRDKPICLVFEIRAPRFALVKTARD